MFNKTNETQLLREIAELKNEVASLKEQQIKSRRDENDRMYNLDYENIPSLNGIVKEIRLIVQDGAVSGALIIQAINSAESEAKIIADHINLSGMTIKLNAGEGITITSPNFKVNSEGIVECAGMVADGMKANDAITENMTCKNAIIEESCILGKGLGTAGMQIGDYFTTRLSSSSVRLVNKTVDSGEASAAIESIKNEMSSDLTRGGTYVSNIQSRPREASLSSFYAAIPGEETEEVARVAASTDGEAYLSAGGYRFWVDENGLHTNAPSIEFDAEV